MQNYPLSRLVINSDIAGSSTGGYPRQAELGRAATSLITAAIKQSAAPDEWTRSPRGDGEVTVAPTSVAPAWVLREFLDTVYAGALDYNRNKRHDDREDHRLRLRIGVAGGDVLVEDDEPTAGGPLTLAQRLQSSWAARQALQALDDAPLAAVIADDVYQRVVPHQANGFQPRQFRAVRVDVNGSPLDAWLYLPHTFPPHVDDAALASPGLPATRPQATPEPKSSKYDIDLHNPQATQVGDGNKMEVNFHGR